MVPGQGSSVELGAGLLQLGAAWLMEWCQKTNCEADETVGTAVAQSLLSKRSADEIASELLDLLGSESMDQLGDLLSHRQAFCHINSLDCAMTP